MLTRTFLNNPHPLTSLVIRNLYIINHAQVYNYNNSYTFGSSQAFRV
jgi:hypothetical protein